MLRSMGALRRVRVGRSIWTGRDQENEVEYLERPSVRRT